MVIIVVIILNFPSLFDRNQSKSEMDITDLNNDHKTDSLDFALFMDNFGKECHNCPEDINKDGLVNSQDYSLLVGQMK